MSLKYQTERCRSGRTIDLGAVLVRDRLHGNIPFALVLSPLMAKSRDLHPIISFCLPICVGMICGSYEGLQPKEVPYGFDELTHELGAFVCQ